MHYRLCNNFESDGKNFLDLPYFSAAKAVKELNLPQFPIEEGIKESYDWLKLNGFIKAS